MEAVTVDDDESGDRGKDGDGGVVVVAAVTVVVAMTLAFMNACVMLTSFDI